VSLRVTLPSLVDRSELVLNTSMNGVIVLEHERWAAPLADLVTQTLARDLERRRSDMMVAAQSGSHAGAAVKVTVDLVQVTVRKGERASIEAHWRILDPRTGGDAVGRRHVRCRIDALRNRHPSLGPRLLIGRRN